MINTSLLRFGGAVQVALSLIRECVGFTEHDYHVVLGPGVFQSLDTSSFPPNFTFYEQSFGVMGLTKVPAVQREMARLERHIAPDCVLSTSGPAFWRSKAPHIMGFNRPLYIYPESPYVRSLSGLSRLRLKAIRSMHGWFYRREADAFIVQTDDVNQRVRYWFNTDAVHTITNTHNDFYVESKQFPQRLPPAKEGVFRFLTLTSYYRHKNLEIIPEVVKVLESRGIMNVEFVLTLTPREYYQHIGNKIPEAVKLVGPVPPLQCPSLYDECDGMFLPTLAECFSASYPEAMVMRKPIVTTDLGFARSICGQSALYFQPCDAEDAAKQVSDLVSDPLVQKGLIESGEGQLKTFDTAKERAQKILELCSSLAHGEQ